METEFTPWVSLAGGLLIGTAAVLLMAVLGRVYGATGIVAGVLFPESGRDWAWRSALLAGIAAAPLVLWAVSGHVPAVQVPVGRGLMVLGGVLVGIGVTFGGGCTSGHGVCGMARLSARSIIATATFMLTTGLTVYVLRHVMGG